MSDDLGSAWAETESSLPDGWRLVVIVAPPDVHGMRTYTVRAGVGGTTRDQPWAWTRSADLVAALRSISRNLRAHGL